MAVFFFIIGLEIKREITAGELSNLKVAILPIIAAIGRMVFTAIIYLYFNTNEVGVNGWGIPMVTDIAFAITALVLYINTIFYDIEMLTSKLLEREKLNFAVLKTSKFKVSTLILESLSKLFIEDELKVIVKIQNDFDIEADFII